MQVLHPCSTTVGTAVSSPPHAERARPRAAKQDTTSKPFTLTNPRSPLSGGRETVPLLLETHLSTLHEGSAANQHSNNQAPASVAHHYCHPPPLRLDQWGRSWAAENVHAAKRLGGLGEQLRQSITCSCTHGRSRTHSLLREQRRSASHCDRYRHPLHSRKHQCLSKPITVTQPHRRHSEDLG